jgi:hypothetical protein
MAGDNGDQDCGEQLILQKVAHQSQRCSGSHRVSIWAIGRFIRFRAE